MDQLEQSRIQVPKKLHSVKTQRLCLKQRFYSFLFRFQEQRAMLENETLRRQALLYIYIFFFSFCKIEFYYVIKLESLNIIQYMFMFSGDL